MDATDFVLVRYAQIHQVLTDPAIKRLSQAQLRGRAHAGVNTVAWLVWHMARVEDVCVKRVMVDRSQVLGGGWFAKLGVASRDVGTGMSDAEVDELSARIDLDALRGYWDAVTQATPDVIATVRGSDLEALVPEDHVRRVALAEG